jgi:hypothetical protein
MAQPEWITPAGSLGIIPEGIFYQQDMLAYTPPLPFAPTCTATSVTTNLITCSSTEGIYPGLNVMFSGTVFGGVSSTVRYFVQSVPNGTQFSIGATERSTTPVALTTATGLMTTVFTQHVAYKLQAGSVPPGIQISDNGLIVGVPQAVASIQGVPFQVSKNVTSKFTVRGYTQKRVNGLYVVDGIRDRTFSLTVSGNNVPYFVTPAGSIGSYYDGDLIDFQFIIAGTDPGDTEVVKLVAGQLPGGVAITPTGRLYGYIEPAANVFKPVGYDLTPEDLYPYDFIVAAINKNYQFTLEVTDGKSSSLRTFNFFVYNRGSLTADNTTITTDNTAVTADETTIRSPFLTNAFPSNLGTVRGDNYYAYQFMGNDYDTRDLRYCISVNQGSGLPPGLTLDPKSGWLYGYVPDQGVTQVEYSFYITVRQQDSVGDTITCTATTFGTNRITCNSTAQLGTGTAIKFSGTAVGGLSTSDTTIYYVLQVINSTQFTVSTNLNSTTPVTLTTASGSFTTDLIVVSSQYPFSLTVSGAIDAEVSWLTSSDLGSVENGSVSLLNVQAVNRGGRQLNYRLKSGAYNQLPQGLQLLPSGDIVGDVSFDTFAVDLGTTTFDATQSVVRNTRISTTTFDSTFEFTVNAYALDTAQVLYKVESVTVQNGGTGYSSVSPPVIKFNSPIGASAVTAQAGNITVSSGVITSVAVANSGAGYTSPATITITEGFGGGGADLVPVMRATGARDVVSAFKTFRVKVIRVYNRPYQNLTVQAMPPENDRVLIGSLLTNQEIFVPDYIFRPDDLNFGLARRVVYQHVFGLAPATLERYVESLYLNHYWKDLVLGEIDTAQALDANGNVIYEVVYSKIQDNLVNDQGQSVNKIVTLPYAIPDPADPTREINSVYPNSLVNMRDQVIDVVGQISTKLPLWMTSKQSNGRVLGFTPAWVICYTKPGRSAQIAYYMQEYFGTQLNRVDFKVDRYILNRTLSRNWDTTTQHWTPAPPTLTTFDRFNTSSYNFVGSVDIGTNLAFADVNQRTLDYIDSLGGLDGSIRSIDGNTLIFVNQETYTDYSSVDAAWQNYLHPFDTTGFDATGTTFDEAVTVPGGDFSTVDQRMAIWTISVDPETTIVSLSLTRQTAINNYVQVVRGDQYRTAYLYYPGSPGAGFTLISWLAVTTLVTAETIFDGGSMAFEVPVDMYDPTDRLDKYLVFPKANILE